jgi:hypothetical protein
MSKICSKCGQRISPQHPSLDNDSIKAAASSILNLSKTFTKSQKKESHVQAILLGFLEHKFPKKMTSEFRVGKKRIDFRKRRPHPSLLELVTIFKAHGNHYPKRNRTELGKLVKFPFQKARRRIIMIIDMYYKKAVEKKELEKKYNAVWNKVTRQRKNIHPVTVMYFHPKADYSFALHPPQPKSKYKS